jgi:hypothetical protein
MNRCYIPLQPVEHKRTLPRTSPPSFHYPILNQLYLTHSLRQHLHYHLASCPSNISATDHLPTCLTNLLIFTRPTFPFASPTPPFSHEHLHHSTLLTHRIVPTTVPLPCVRTMQCAAVHDINSFTRHKCVVLKLYRIASLSNCTQETTKLIGMMSTPPRHEAALYACGIYIHLRVLLSTGRSTPAA